MSNTPTSLVGSSDELSIASTSSSVYVAKRKTHLSSALRFVTAATKQMALDFPKRVVSNPQNPRRALFESAWDEASDRPCPPGHKTAFTDSGWMLPPILIKNLHSYNYALHLPFLIRVQYGAALSRYPNLGYVRTHEFLRKMCIAVMAVRAGVMRFLGVVPSNADQMVYSAYSTRDNNIIQNPAELVPAIGWVTLENAMNSCAPLNPMEYEAACLMVNYAPNIIEYNVLLATGEVPDLVLAHTMKWIKGELKLGMNRWQARAIGLDDDEIFEMALASATIGYDKVYLSECIQSDQFMMALRASGAYDAQVKESSLATLRELVAATSVKDADDSIMDYMPDSKKMIPIKPDEADQAVEIMTPAQEEEVAAGVQKRFLDIFSQLPARNSSLRGGDSDSQAG